MNKAIFCLSLDTELMWGRHILKNHNEFIWRVRKEREVISDLLNLFAKYNIPASWAIIGHLFLDKCSSKSGRIHPEIDTDKKHDDWFKLDPASSIKKFPEWYGKDIVKKIMKLRNQEIASHSFSHVLFGKCSKKWAESEVKECVRIAKKMNLKLESFVFPYNLIGHLDVLSNYGFRFFRGQDKYWYSNFSLLSKVLAAVDLFLLISPPVYKPKVENKMINIPGSMYLVSARGIRKLIPRGVRFLKAKRGIDKAIKEKKVFHLWTHPIDLVDKKEDLLIDFERILQYAGKKRKEGILAIKTMREIGKNYEKTKNPRSH